MSPMIQTLDALVRLYADLGVDRMYIKLLAPNDNSKNQLYLGPGFEALTLFPLGNIVVNTSAAEPTYKAPMDFYWVGDDQSLIHAPGAQVILYPAYPEIRFSGFLKGADRTHLEAARSLMTSRTPGRVLAMGVGASSRIIGSVFGPDSPVAQELLETLPTLARATDIFYELIATSFLGVSEDPKQILLRELCRVHRLGWINSKRLDGSGTVLPCHAPQCGGYTLEAELGITPNGRAEPDFMGWELKTYSTSVLTLMTPEPNGGFYTDEGVENFVRTFGYPDRLGRADRLNFGGVHVCGIRHRLTGLTLIVRGYDAESGKITDVNGGIGLINDDGILAAHWAFTGILSHWNKKHRSVAYVRTQHRAIPANQYRYGVNVLLGEGTDPLMLIAAVYAGRIYYDPAIKLESASSSRPTIKRRSQFRVRLNDLSTLYESVVSESLIGYCG